MPTPLRWGILGTGNIAGQFATGLAGSARNTIAAIGSRSSENAIAFSKQHNIPRVHGSYDSAIADDQVDAIYNSLPNSLHHEWTIKALRAGKHVLCEKPIATNTTEAREMFEAAEKAGRLLTEAFMYRSNPQTHAIAKAVADGAIGERRLIRTSFCYHTRKIEGNIRFSRELAGGALMDIGCYCVNFARHFAKAEPNAISAQARFHNSGVDILTVGSLQFPNGLLSTFTCGMDTHADNTALLCGSDGYIEIPIPWKPPAKEATFTICRGTPPKMDGASKPAPGPSSEIIRVPIEGELYGFEADDFAAAVLDGAPLRVSQQDSIGNMIVLDQIRRQIGLKFPTDR